MQNEIWTEKYRPKTFEEFVGITNFNEIIKFCETPFKLPYLLFIGKHGSGKTTLAKIIIRKLDAEYLLLNASDESGIDTIRGKVKSFAKTLSKNQDSPKIIFLDESDYLSKNSQAALRGIIEQYSKSCRFIMTANYRNKILPELQSRLSIIEFGSYNKDDISSHLIEICKKENILYDKEVVKNLVNLKYPDIRAMIKILNYNKEIINKTLNEKNILYDSIFDMIKTRKLLDTRKIWNEQNIDLQEFLYFIFEKVISLNYTVQEKKEIIEIIAETDYRLSISATPDIQMFNFIIKVKV